jgi:hypothetical protein
MTHAQSTPDQQDEENYEDAPVNTEDPQDDGEPIAPQPDVDPVTVRQTDPAAMSEHERNLRQQEQYNAGL